LAQFVLATNSFITYSEDRLHQWLMPLLPNTTDSSRKWVLQGAGSNKFVWVDMPTVAGVTDHGELDGLEDNDHPQYALTTDPRFHTHGNMVSLNRIGEAGSPTVLPTWNGAAWPGGGGGNLPDPPTGTTDVYVLVGTGTGTGSARWVWKKLVGDNTWI
jgi:hypothetical protein